MVPRAVTVLRPPALGLLCVAALLACGTAVPSHSAHTGSTASPLAAVSFTPFPTPSGTPPFRPRPGLTPPPAGVVEGGPPIHFDIPAGYSVDLSTPSELVLTSASGAERLSFAVDPAMEDLSHPLRTIAIGGETGVVIEDGVTGFGYREDVIVSHQGVQYEALCVGYSGYDSARLTSGCHAFLTSIVFTS